MQIKKDRMDFLNGNLEKVALYLKNKNNLSRYINQCSRLGHINKLNRIIFCSLNYKFIHPVLDDYSQHLRLLSLQFDDKSTVIYIPKTQKGIYAKDFFRLSEFESRDLNISTQFLHDPDNISDYSVPSLV